MRKVFLPLLAAVAFIGALSCSKSLSTDESPTSLPTGTLTVHVGPEMGTKSAYADRLDFQISSIQLFVFDSAGKLETDYYSTVTPTSDPVSATFSTFTGAKTVYAVANFKRLFLEKDFAIADFEALTSDVKDNSPTKLVMVGKNEITVTEYDKNKNASAAPQNLNIYLKRLAAMIVLDKITIDFSKTSLSDATFTIKDIYLKNVVGKCHLGLDGLTGSAKASVYPLPLSDEQHSYDNWWYNMLTKPATGFIPAVIVDTWTHECPEVAGGDGNPLGRCLFAYPNKTTVDSHAATFSPRMTRLVIKALVDCEEITPTDGVETFYVFDLPTLAANTVYKVTDIKISMLGKDNDNNDDNLQGGKVTPTITVDAWAGTTNLSYDF